MVVFLKFRNFFCTIEFKRVQSLHPFTPLSRFCHFESKRGVNPSDPSLSLEPKIAQNNVAIFWDLDNKPPKSFPPYDAAVKLKAAASSLGVVRYTVAYANHHTFSYVPQVVREQRKERKMLNQLEKAVERHLCRVCGRKFYTNEKLVNHFKQIHEREQMKRLSQIESARGTKRVKLVAKYSMKMQKYKNAVRDVLNLKVGYGLADELKRAGFLVRTVSDKSQAVDVALKNHMVDMIDGALKRVADAGFSWAEILMGKAKKEAVSVVGKWRDRDVLKRLEWTYNPEVEKKIYDYEDEVVEDSEDDCEGTVTGVVDDNVHEEDSNIWWQLDSDGDVVSSQSLKRLECTYNPEVEEKHI